MKNLPPIKSCAECQHNKLFLSFSRPGKPACFNMPSVRLFSTADLSLDFPVWCPLHDSGRLESALEKIVNSFCDYPHDPRHAVLVEEIVCDAMKGK